MSTSCAGRFSLSNFLPPVIAGVISARAEYLLLAEEEILDLAHEWVSSASSQGHEKETHFLADRITLLSEPL